MVKELFAWAGAMFRVVEDTRETREEIKEIRRELDDLALGVLRCVGEVARVGEREQAEREMPELKLENMVLRTAIPAPETARGVRASWAPREHANGEGA